MNIKGLGAIFLALAFIIVSGAGCGTKVYTKGKYINPQKKELLSDKFVESDLQFIADKLANSLINSDVLNGKNRKPAIIISLFSNATDEHIDILSLTNKIRTILFKSKRFVFLNERLRKAISKEYEYQGSGYVDPATAKAKGSQIGADWMISGHITSIRQPVGRKEIVYYKTTLEVTNIKTSQIVWTDDVEVKKAFKLKRVTF